MVHLLLHQLLMLQVVYDVIIPLSFSGDAEFNQDYTVDFDTEGDRNNYI